MQKQGRTVIARSKATKQSNFSLRLWIASEPVIGARFRATRWFAMTKAVGWLPGSPQHARKDLADSPTISGCRASDTAGDIRITSAWAPKIAAAR
jgi:hypothetical protein